MSYINTISKNILIILGVITIVFLLLLFIDFMFWMFGYNINKILRPERYNRSFLEENYNFNDNIKQTVDRGKKRAKESKLVICTLCRNISKNFKKSSKQLEDIGKLFKDYKIVVYENDSEDNSRDLLTNWSKNNNKVILLDCCQECEKPYPSDCCDEDKYSCKLKYKKGYDMGPISKGRTEMMKKHRNTYLDYVKENLSDYDYLCVFDFDAEGGILKSGIYHTIGLENWDGIFANGRMPLPPFGGDTLLYDTFAHVDLTDKKSNIFDNFKSILNEGRNINSPLIQVKSAFNGMAFYKINSILDSEYKVLKSPKNCEHIGLHFDMKEKNKGIFYINPMLLLYMGMQGPDNKFKAFFKDFFKNNRK